MAISMVNLSFSRTLSDCHFISHVRLKPLISDPLSEINPSRCTPKALTPNKKAFCPSLKVSNKTVTLSFVRALKSLFKELTMKFLSTASASIPINKCVLLKRILTDVLLIDFKESVGNNCQKFSALLAFNQMSSLSFPSSIIFSLTFFTSRDRFVF